VRFARKQSLASVCLLMDEHITLSVSNVTIAMSQSQENSAEGMAIICASLVK